MTQHYTYMSAIGQAWSSVNCSTTGDESDYSSIVWESGDPLPAQSVLDAWIREAEIADKSQEIKNEKERRWGGGVYESSTGKWFSTDNHSRMLYIGMTMMPGLAHHGIMWKTLDGSTIEMTQNTALQITHAIVNKDILDSTASEQHQTQAAASVHPALYDFKNNSPVWLQIYGEQQ